MVLNTNHLRMDKEKINLQDGEIGYGGGNGCHCYI